MVIIGYSDDIVINLNINIILNKSSGLTRGQLSLPFFKDGTISC